MTKTALATNANSKSESIFTIYWQKLLNLDPKITLSLNRSWNLVQNVSAEVTIFIVSNFYFV